MKWRVKYHASQHVAKISLTLSRQHAGIPKSASICCIEQPCSLILLANGSKALLAAAQRRTAALGPNSPCSLEAVQARLCRAFWSGRLHTGPDYSRINIMQGCRCWTTWAVLAQHHQQLHTRIENEKYSTYNFQQLRSEMRYHIHCCFLQGRHNIGDRDLERDIIPMCREMGLGVASWSVLGAGKFTGRFKRVSCSWLLSIPKEPALKGPDTVAAGQSQI